MPVVRRLARYIFVLCAAVSLVLIVGVYELWVLSSSAWNTMIVSGQRKGVQVIVAHGRIKLVQIETAPTDPRRRLRVHHQSSAMTTWRLWADGRFHSVRWGPVVYGYVGAIPQRQRRASLDEARAEIENNM